MEQSHILDDPKFRQMIIELEKIDKETFNRWHEQCDPDLKGVSQKNLGILHELLMDAILKKEKEWTLSEPEIRPDGSIIYTITNEKTRVSVDSSEGCKNETMSLLSAYLSALKGLR